MINRAFPRTGRRLLAYRQARPRRLQSGVLNMRVLGNPLAVVGLIRSLAMGSQALGSGLLRRPGLGSHPKMRQVLIGL